MEWYDSTWSIWQHWRHQSHLGAWTDSYNMQQVMECKLWNSDRFSVQGKEFYTFIALCLLSGVTQAEHRYFYCQPRRFVVALRKR